MMELFKSLVSTKMPGYGHKDLLALLVNPVMSADGSAIHKQVIRFVIFRLLM